MGYCKDCMYSTAEDNIFDRCLNLNPQTFGVTKRLRQGEAGTCGDHKPNYLRRSGDKPNGKHSDRRKQTALV